MNEYQMRRLLLSILVSFLVMQISAQELTVKSFVENTKDLSASTSPRNDNNGTPCALIKVRIAAKGVLFEGNVVGNVDYRTSEYWVYMAKGSKRLTLKLEDYLPLDVAFADYAINALESKMTYMLTITKEPIRNVVQIQSEPKPEEHYDDVQPLEFAVSGVTFKMMYVKGGTFTMGASLSDAEARDDESPRHKVTVDDFYLCSHEVTQALWRAVMGSEVSNNGGWQPESGRGNNYPVYKVTWNECMTFINRLNTLLAKQLEEERKKEEERIKIKAKQAELEAYNEVKDLFTQQDTQIRDSRGVRWIKCEICGQILPSDKFVSYGGLNHINLGTCNDCSRKHF